MKLNIVAPVNTESFIKNCMPASFANQDISLSVNGHESMYDGIVVLQSTRGYKMPDMKYRSGNSLLMIYEPQDILRISRSYIQQFDYVITPNQKIKGRNTINCAFGQMWSIDKTYEQLCSLEPPVNKINKVSAVISTKAITRGHKKRLDFVSALKDELGDLFKWYGKGVCEIDDKWEAIYPYRYQLVFENGKWHHYWTEKLTDAFMGYSMPLYIGCPNLADYFSQQSYLELDDTDPKQAAAQIKSAIANKLYNESVKKIIEARDLIFNKYGLFPMLSSLIEKYFNLESSSRKTIQFSKFKNTVHL